MTDSTLFPDDRCTGCGQTPKGDGCWVCRPTELLTDAERDTLLAPCACGHTINDHGSLVACWLCAEEGDPKDCGTAFEDLLCERVAVIVTARVTERHTAACPDHPTIPRADCVCPYPGEESP